VNQPITRLFLVVMVLFAGLAGATSWWTVVKADELNTEKTDQNRRELLRGRGHPRCRRRRHRGLRP